MSKKGQPQENGKPSGGNGGALFGHEQQQAGGQRYLRSDARLAARLISLGAVSLEQAESLLKAGFGLAAKSAQKEDARGYAACMKIALATAKLAQDERHKLLDKMVPDKHEIATTNQELSQLLGELRENDRYAEAQYAAARGIGGQPGANGNGRK